MIIMMLSFCLLSFSGGMKQAIVLVKSNNRTDAVKEVLMPMWFCCIQTATSVTTVRHGVSKSASTTSAPFPATANWASDWLLTEEPVRQVLAAL